jgi:hypothetical protein
MRAIAQDGYGAADALGVETRLALRGQIGRETVKTTGRSITGQQKAGGLDERSEQPLPIEENFA